MTVSTAVERDAFGSGTTAFAAEVTSGGTLPGYRSAGVVIYGQIAKDMTRSHHFSKSLRDVERMPLASMIACKAEELGNHFAKIEPGYTPQKCSKRRETVEESLPVRGRGCTGRGLVPGRSVFAAMNVFCRARSVMASPSPSQEGTGAESCAA